VFGSVYSFCALWELEWVSLVFPFVFFYLVFSLDLEKGFGRGAKLNV